MQTKKYKLFLCLLQVINNNFQILPACELICKKIDKSIRKTYFSLKLMIVILPSL